MTDSPVVLGVDQDPTLATSAQRRQLGDFLRSRREALQPKDVGMSVLATRRRTPGLRREELAGLAGVSVTWYTWLEQGRDIKPSRQVLIALGRALLLDAEQCDHLLWLGGFPPIGVRTGTKVVEPAVARVLEGWTIGPAYVTDTRLDVIAVNAACREVFDGFIDDGDESDACSNYVKWLFVGAGRSAIVDWEADARRLCGVFRELADRHAADPLIAERVAFLTAHSHEFAEWWRRHDVLPRRAGRKTVIHPDGSLVRYEHTAYSILGMSDCSLVLCLPLS